MRDGVYDNSAPFELNQGLVRLHNAIEYRTMLLDTAIKPVIRVSNMDAEATRRELERYRALGYHAAPCHAAYHFDEGGLYDFEGEGTLFYIFASASKASLDEMLEVDRLQKTDMDAAHKLDHALEVGRLLGYPACCTRFYASFEVNPHQTTFQLRPYQATTGPILPWVHPTMRLLGHFACSLGCQVTNGTHRAILDAMAERLPEFHAWVEPAFRYPVLFMDHDGAVFEGTASGNTVEYGQVWHGDPSEAAPDSLRDHLNRGDRARIEGPWVRVFDGDRLLGEHDTRDRTLLPLFVPMDGKPIGKRVRNVVVPDQTQLARYLAGDLIHMGYRASLVATPRLGELDAFFAAAAERGVDTVVMTVEAPELAERFRRAGIGTIGVGCPGDHTFEQDRHAFAYAFERLSRGLDPTPVAAPPLDEAAQTAEHLNWPATLRFDLISGNPRPVDDSLAPQPRPAPMPKSTAPKSTPKVPPTVAVEAPPIDWVTDAVDRLAGLDGNPFGRVRVLEQGQRVVVVAHVDGGLPVGIGLGVADRSLKITVDRALTDAETKWLKALRALLHRRLKA